jgi:hypothetical protein
MIDRIWPAQCDLIGHTRVRRCHVAVALDGGTPQMAGGPQAALVR